MKNKKVNVARSHVMVAASNCIPSTAANSAAAALKSLYVSVDPT